VRQAICLTLAGKLLQILVVEEKEIYYSAQFCIGILGVLVGGAKGIHNLRFLVEINNAELKTQS